MRRLHVVALVMALARCGRGAPARSAEADAHGGALAAVTSSAAPGALGGAARAPGALGGAARVPVSIGAAARPAASSRLGDDDVGADLWQRAADGEDDDLARLADREGAAGLVERALASLTPGGPARLTAIRALAYADGLSALPFLAEAARAPGEVEAAAALESLAAIAVRPRRAVDPEDAAELREGCDTILALARDVARPRSRRAGAVRFLRLMEGRGCAPPEGIPTDADTVVR